MITFAVSQDTKPIIKDSNDIEYINFLEKDINIIDAQQPPTGIDYYLVNKDTSMRIDLVSKTMYGYIDPVEKILKFNGISNPLSINEGDILVVYDLYSLNRNMRDVSQSAQNKIDVRKQYLSPEKSSKIDPSLQAFNKKDDVKKTEKDTGTTLPPNYAGFGDKEIQVRNGKLYFGSGISNSSDASEEPLSKSEFIARLVKNRINNG